MNIKGKSSTPAAPDPKQVSQAQTQSNKETALYNSGLNRPDQYTPYGSETYKYLGMNDDGSPHYRSDVNFTPLGQKMFDQQQQQDQSLNDIGSGYMDRIKGTMGQEFNPNGVPALQDHLDLSGSPRLPGVDDFSADRKRVEDAMYARINPELERDQAGLDSRLANQGIMQGSEAYNHEQNMMGQQRNDARNQAVLAGGAEQSRLFGLGLSARQQSVGEQTANANLGNSAHTQALQEAMMKRQMPLNEFNALRSASQLQGPQFSGMQPIGMNNTDVAGNYWNAYKSQLDASNAKQASNNAMMGAMGQAAGSAAAAYFSSGS